MSIVPVPNFCASINDPTLCGHCLRGNRFCLHHVPIHHTGASLCTSCVLRLYPQLFCPTCFEVYESPTEENVVICSECCRSTHFHCVRPKSPDPYICSACVDPNSLIFVVDRKSDSDLENVGIEDYREKDKGGMIFLAATMIVAVLMRKVADAAGLVAERKAALAALAKQKVFEALEYVYNTRENENLRGMRVGELASKPGNELGSDSAIGSYNSAGRGAGRGPGRGRGRAAGYSSRGRGVGRGRGRVHGLDAGGSSRGRGVGRGRGRGRVHCLAAGCSIRGCGAMDGRGRVHDLAASDSDSDSDYNPESDPDSDSDYVGSRRTCKRKYPVKNTDILSL